MKSSAMGDPRRTHVTRLGDRKSAAAALVDFTLRAVALAMGVSVAILAILDALSASMGLSMLGIGLSCLGVLHIRNNKD